MVGNLACRLNFNIRRIYLRNLLFWGCSFTNNSKLVHMYISLKLLGLFFVFMIIISVLVQCYVCINLAVVTYGLHTGKLLD
jgi:hypothetical protein